MIDLEKEREAFKQKMINENPDYFSWIGTDSDFAIWQMCAEEKQYEINDLKKQLDEVHKSRASWVEYSKNVESSEFVLVPREPTMNMLIKGRNIVNRCLNIPETSCAYKAMIEAMEKDDD